MDAPRDYFVDCLGLDTTILHLAAELGCSQNISIHLLGLYYVQNCIPRHDLPEICQPPARHPATTCQSMRTSCSEELTLISVQGGSYILGHLKGLVKDPAGMAWRDWVDEVPHDGIIKILALFQQERLLVVRYVLQRAELSQISTEEALSTHHMLIHQLIAFLLILSLEAFPV